MTECARRARTTAAALLLLSACSQRASRDAAAGAAHDDAYRDAALSRLDATNAGRDAPSALDPAADAAQLKDAVVGDAARDAHAALSDANGFELDASSDNLSTSCFGRCNHDALLAIPGACACDVACLTRGDCCADKHELCAVSERAVLCPLTGASADPAVCGADLGWSFTHGEELEIFFGDSYDVGCNVPLLYDDAQGRLPRARPSELPTRPPATPIACARLITLDKQANAFGDSFAPMRLFEDGVALSSWLAETPLTGFSDGAAVYTLSRRGNQLGAPLYLARRDASAAPSLPARTVYRVLTQYATQRFQNPTIATVVAYDPSTREHDYGEGTGALFLWGRAAFFGADAARVYLAYQPLPIADGASWAPRYFAGAEDGVPRWSDDESAAVPVLEHDFVMTMQLEVAWIAELDKWIMLYGGDAADSLNTDPSDQPRHGALHMRMADHPWGPWTRATPVFFREHAAGFLRCDAPSAPPPGLPSGCDLDELPSDPAHSYSPGAWGAELLDFPGCVVDSPIPRSPAVVPGSSFPCLGVQRGNMYAPNLIVPWTVDRRGEHGYAHAATLYFNVSTWSPYQVILAALSVHLP